MSAANQCRLCQTTLKYQKYCYEEALFCCHGCLTVYQILSAKSVLDNFQDHPLFKQAVRSGLISNPDLMAEIDQEREKKTFSDYQKLHLEIQEMWCPSCAQVISLVLLKEKGISRCMVDYVTDLAVIEFTPKVISNEKILQLIEALGYTPVSLQDPRKKAVSYLLTLRFIVAAFFSLNIMMFSYPVYASYFDQEFTSYSSLFALLSLVSSIPVLTFSGWPIWQRLYHGMKLRIVGMEALVLVGVGAAMALSIYELTQGTLHIYFDSMSVIIVFVLLGKMIESKAKFSAKDALLQLTRALPRKGRKKMPDGTWQFVLLKEVEIGDQLSILRGERIVLDGVVIEGTGACDESVMTGESLPVVKEKSSLVLAGAILQQGNLIIEVSAKLEETALKQIINMVEQDISHKSKQPPLIDLIVKWFVPTVLVLAIATLCFSLSMGNNLSIAITKAVSLLLISCPCAIGIAAPLAEAYTLNALAKMGAIVRNRSALGYLGKEDYFICDKTGTITEGKFTVLSGLENLSTCHQQMVKGLVQQSNHPVALSLQDFFKSFPAILPDEVEEIAGRGLKGKFGLEKIWLGSEQFLKESGEINLPSTATNLPSIYTMVYLKIGKAIRQLILGDQIKEGAKQMVTDFGKASTLLVSGDHSKSVEFVAKSCGFTQWYAGYSPLQKRNLIDSFNKEGKIVTMIGDGINDAPSLTAAHVGIAVVSAADISVQVSDILLTTNQLSTLRNVRQIAVLSRRIIRQNLFWAFFYNCIGITLAMAGYLTPLFAAFAMITSSLIVLANSHRIQTVQNKA